MYKVSFLFISMVYSLLISGQTIEVMNLSKNTFKNKNEISGIAIQNDILFLASEKCKKIYLINKINFQNIDSIELKTLFPNNVQIEALLYLNDNLYMTDEENCKIWVFDIKERKLSHLKPETKETENDIKSFKYKMEGIAINNDILFLLKEKNTISQSEIHTYKIDFEKKSITLKSKIYITLKPNFRYTDLYFDNSSSVLFAIKSSDFPNDRSKNEFFVDEIGLELLGQNTTINSDTFRSIYNLTDTAKYYYKKKNMSHNFEGITADKQFIYLVSDNASTPTSGECLKEGRMPLFVRIRR